MTVREETLRIEESILAPRAAHEADSRGRRRPEEPCPARCAPSTSGTGTAFCTARRFAA